MKQWMQITRLISILVAPWLFCADAHATLDTINKTREIPERIAGHVFFLAAHSALADTKNLILPTLFTESLVKQLTDQIYTNGTSCLRAFWTEHQEQILTRELSCREFIFLLIALYHNLACTKTASLRGIPWLSLAALYMRLQAIPLNKLFDILDECLSYYQAILNDYGTPAEPAPSLSDWLIDYWWLPAFMVGMTVAAFARWLRAHQAQTKRSMEMGIVATSSGSEQPDSELSKIVVAGECVNSSKNSFGTAVEIENK